MASNNNARAAFKKKLGEDAEAARIRNLERIQREAARAAENALALSNAQKAEQARLAKRKEQRLEDNTKEMRNFVPYNKEPPYEGFYGGRRNKTNGRKSRARKTQRRSRKGGRRSRK